MPPGNDRLVPGYEFTDAGPRPRTDPEARAFRAEWHGRSDFAEVAEALGIFTDEVMAMTKVGQDEGYLVLYSTGTADEATAVVHRALLERGADRVLRMTKHHRMGSLSEFMERADEELGPYLEERLGPPSH